MEGDLTFCRKGRKIFMLMIRIIIVINNQARPVSPACVAALSRTPWREAR